MSGSRRRPLRAAALAAAGVLVLLGIAGAAVATFAQLTYRNPPAPTAGPASPSPRIPWLTKADKAKSIQILAGDPRAKAIFAGASYSVNDIGPWTTNDQKKLGAAMVIVIRVPMRFDVVDWPAVQYQQNGRSRPYRERTLPASATDVTAFEALVDLNRDRVVSLRPDNGKMQIAPGTERWWKPTPD